MEAKTQHLVNTIWAFATMVTLAPNLANAVDNVEVIKKFIGHGNAQDFANTVWALETLKHEVK